eukprot:534663-Karenia_brevis.AAC.1
MAKEDSQTYIGIFKDKANTETNQMKEKVGPMNVHIFNAIVKWVVNMKPKGLEEEEIKAVQEAVKSWPTWHIIAKHVPHCKVSKSFHSD